MKLEFYRPQNSQLKKYIEGYYFIAPDNNPAPLHYWTFPNNFFIVSVSLNMKMEVAENKFIIEYSTQKNTVANFVARYKTPIEIVYKDAIDEITLYFKPLGTHHFMDDVPKLLQQQTAFFDPYPDFKEVMNEILQMQNRAMQIETLEQYWLSKMTIKDLGPMEAILADIESDLKVDEIATKNNFSRQYLNNLFTKNTGKSPSEYRKIHRFRTAIAKKKDAKNLTDLTYDSLFYDQSHMIKDFKELTRVSPHSFFKKVDTGKENIWLFI